jgi:hypothetical protein
MGNRQGPHVLATDWVGTHLAKWFGLSTFDIAILRLDADDEFPLPSKVHGDGRITNYTAQPGPAFAAKALAGDPWGKSGLQLDLLINPDDITRLVVFDMWTLNCDRHISDMSRKPNYDNVYLSSEGVEVGKRRLIAMDHGLCFIRSGEDLTPRLAHIDKVQDQRVYGLFPEFQGRLRAGIIDSCTRRLREMDAATAEAMIATVPREWEVATETRQAWSQLIYRRAGVVADNIQTWIESIAPWFGTNGA